MASTSGNQSPFFNLFFACFAHFVVALYPSAVQAAGEVLVDPAGSAAWVAEMLELRSDFIKKSDDRSRAASALRLHELKLGPWHRFEFSLFGEAGKAAWDSSANAIHGFRTPLEESFLEVGVIDPAAEYRGSIKDGTHQPRNRFRRIGIKDGSLWPSPRRYANRAEFYWRTVGVESARTVDLHLGYSEGCRVYLNGKEIFIELVVPPRRAEPNQVSVTLDLRKGTNHLLVKLSSWRAHPREHLSYSSFNPVPPLDLKQAALRLFADFPVQADWFMQDLDRLSTAPVGADLRIRGLTGLLGAKGLCSRFLRKRALQECVLTGTFSGLKAQLSGVGAD